MMPPSSVSASFLLSFYAVIPQIERSRFFAIFSRATLSERQDRIDGRSVYQCKSPAGGALTHQAAAAIGSAAAAAPIARPYGEV